MFWFREKNTTKCVEVVATLVQLLQLLYGLRGPAFCSRNRDGAGALEARSERHRHGRADPGLGGQGRKPESFLG